LTRRPGQKLSCNPLIFVFFLLKRRYFNFFYKKELTRSKPGTRALNRTRSKNYALKDHCLLIPLIFIMKLISFLLYLNFLTTYISSILKKHLQFFHMWKF
jgi:hypothetical protein